MKKGRFLWSAHRITERQKAGKARNIKGKQLKNSRSTVSKRLAVQVSSPRDKQVPSMEYNTPKANRLWGVLLCGKGIFPVVRLSPRDVLKERAVAFCFKIQYTIIIFFRGG